MRASKRLSPTLAARKPAAITPSRPVKNVFDEDSSVVCAAARPATTSARARALLDVRFKFSSRMAPRGVLHPPCRTGNPGWLERTHPAARSHRMDPKDLTTYLGLAAVYLLAVNVLLGLLMGARYNPWKRWPHRRINLLKLHNWTAYVALALSALHPIPLLFIDKPRFAIADILYPVSSPEQPVIN